MCVSVSLRLSKLQNEGVFDTTEATQLNLLATLYFNDTKMIIHKFDEMIVFIFLGLADFCCMRFSGF